METITDTYPGYGLPAFLGAVTTGHSIVDQLGLAETTPEHERENQVSLLLDQIAVTASSIRNDEGPQTMLHALMLYDGLTLGELSGIIQANPLDQEPKMEAFVKLGVVKQDGSGPFASYWIVPPDAYRSNDR